MIAALVLIVTLQSAGEPQWVSGRIQDRDPFAAFLSWNFSSVILRATCRGRDVGIDYFGDGVVPHDVPQTALIVDDATFDMRRTAPGEYVLNADGVAALQSGRWVEFDAPNEMDEPWYLGEAHALKHLAATCSGAAE